MSLRWVTIVMLVLGVPSVYGQDVHPLREAIAQGDVATVEALIDDGEDPNAMFLNERFPIHDAALYQRMDILMVLLERGAEPDREDVHGETPLDIVLRNGMAPAFCPLYRQIELTRPAIRLDVPAMLDEAVSRGHRELLEEMLDPEEVLPKSTGVEMELYFKAAEYGSISVLQYFVEQGQSANQTMDGTGWTALHFVAYDGHATSVTWLLEQEVDVNAADARGMTPLHMAAYHGNEEVAQFLLKAGAMVDAADEHERTPLHIAAYRGYGAFIQVLLENGASPQLKTAAGQTPLDIVRARNYSGLRTLFPVNSATPAKASSDYTDTMRAIRRAIQQQEKGVLAELLASGEVNVKQVDRYGKTLLYYASDVGDLDTVKALLKAAADVNRADASSQWTPLMFAVANGHRAVVEELLNAEAEVNAQGAAGWTALHLAEFLGHSEIKAILIEAGASESVKDKLGHTPTELAATGRAYRDKQLMKVGMQ